MQRVGPILGPAGLPIIPAQHCNATGASQMSRGNSRGICHHTERSPSSHRGLGTGGSFWPRTALQICTLSSCRQLQSTALLQKLHFCNSGLQGKSHSLTCHVSGSHQHKATLRYCLDCGVQKLGGRAIRVQIHCLIAIWILHEASRLVMRTNCQEHTTLAFPTRGKTLLST